MKDVRPRGKSSLKDVVRLRKQSITFENGVEKSTYDYRSYKTIHLDNGLEAMLVHDPLNAFSAAALSVKGKRIVPLLKRNAQTYSWKVR